jgi:hypothetical protein
MSAESDDVTFQAFPSHTISNIFEFQNLAFALQEL